MSTVEEKAAAHIELAKKQAAIDSRHPGRQRSCARSNSVAVIGAGTMGGGIAMALANIGIPVTLIDAEAAGLERGLARLRDNYAGSVARGKLAQEAMDARLALIKGSLELADVAAADLVIEAVFEDMALKKSIFANLDKLARPGAVLATNTSGLDVDEIAAATHAPRPTWWARISSARRM